MTAFLWANARMLVGACCVQLLEKRKSQQAKKDEYEFKLRDIGTVPADVERFKAESSKRVCAGVACAHSGR